MTKIAIITDQHCGARNDSIQFHDYFEKFYKECFFPHIDKEGITHIIEMGDIFDRRKYINFYSLYRFKQYFFDEIKKRNITLHCIIGNHDIYYKNTNKVNAPKLLLGEYDFNIYEETAEVEIDNNKFLFVPWINQENEKQSFDLISKTKAKIVFGHLEFSGF